MKGKVLSVRIRSVDIASAKELCELVGFHAPNMSTCVAKALSLLLANLREKGTLPEHTTESASAVLNMLAGGQKIGRDFDLSKLDLPLPPGRIIRDEWRVPQGEQPLRTVAAHAQAPDVIHRQSQQDSSFAGAAQPLSEVDVILASSAITPAEYQSQLTDLDDYPALDESIVADIRLQQQLESDTLLDALLVTTHRRDDAEVELIDPSTMVKPKEEEPSPKG